MKQRYSSLDLHVVAHELNNTLSSHRVANIYDISSRIFLFKFALPESKHQLIVDSGFRAHLTSFSRETSPSPSSFVQKLRKYLKTRRLSSVRQIGTDRILEFTFSDGLYRLYLEFFASGNVILVDGEGTILALLRLVTGESVECKPGVKYQVPGEKAKRVVTVDELRTTLEATVKVDEEPAAVAETTATGRKFKKKKKPSETTIKRVLGFSYAHLNPALIERCLFEFGIEGSVQAAEAAKDGKMLETLVTAIEKAEEIVQSLYEAKSVKGYIVAKDPAALKNKAEAPAEDQETGPKGVRFGDVEGPTEEPQQKSQSDGFIYDDYHPFFPKQLEGKPGIKIIEFEGYNKTVDEFYSSIESQKLSMKVNEREIVAAKRLASVREEHQKRVDVLRGTQTLNIRKAEAIEANADRVEEAIAAITTLISQGMDWVNIARLIENEQKRGNPLAELIKLPLKLFENKITLRLGEASWEEEEDAEESEEEEDSDEDSDEEDDKKKKKSNTNWLEIDVDLYQSAWANARKYYDEKKSAAVKEQKTQQSSTKAIKSAERKVAQDLKKGLKKEKQLMRALRNPFWFEKFYWFMSSENYLVIGARDLQQTELILRRHFKKGDLLVHCDIDGAAVLIVKNEPRNHQAPIPPSTLSQAGQFAVSSSNAWDKKQVVSAWWASHDQVTKKDQRGDILPVGKFEVNGEKNFLPPAALVMGFGMMWLIDEDSRRRRCEEEPAPPVAAEAETKEDEDNAENLSENEIAADSKCSRDSKEDKEEADEEDESDEEFPDAQLQTDSEEEEEKEDVKPAESEKNYRVGPSQEEEVQADDVESKPENETEAKEAEDTTQTTRRRLTAKERRDLKKGKVVDLISESPSGPSSRSETPSSLKKGSGPAPLPRGKRSKAKKLKEKYALQDEEERELALRLVGAVSNKDEEDKAKSKEAQQESAEAQKQRRKEQHLRAAQKAAEALEEEESDEEGSEERALEQVRTLQRIVPSLTPEDVVIDVLPTCMPWTSATKLKYKVKMQPGPQKKGKAVKEMIEKQIIEGQKKSNFDERGLDPEKVWPKELDLFKGIRMTEVVGYVPVGSVKISMTRGSEKDGKSKKGGGGGKSGGGKKKK